VIDEAIIAIMAGGLLTAAADTAGRQPAQAGHQVLGFGDLADDRRQRRPGVKPRLSLPRCRRLGCWEPCLSDSMTDGEAEATSMIVLYQMKRLRVRAG
jgi:hypothetical protein